MWKNIIYILLVGTLTNFKVTAQIDLTHGSHGLTTTGEQVSISSSKFDANQDRIPDSFVVRQNFPNPFNHSTTIEYDLPQETGVHAIIYDIFGRRIKTLQDGLQEPGRHQLEWDGTESNGEEVAGGVYFYVLATNNNYSVGKMFFSKRRAL